MIFSWNDADPVSDDPTAVMYHGTNRGVLSLNLLGGQQEVPAEPSDVDSFDAVVNTVRIKNGVYSAGCSFVQCTHKVYTTV